MTDILSLAAHVQERATAAATIAAAERVLLYMSARGLTAMPADSDVLGAHIAQLPQSASRPVPGTNTRMVTVHRLRRVLGY